MSVGNPSWVNDETGERILLDESGWQKLKERFDVADIKGLTIFELRFIYDALDIHKTLQDHAGTEEDVETRDKIHKKIRLGKKNDNFPTNI